MKRFSTTISALIIVCSMLLAVFMTGAAMAAAPDLPSSSAQYKSNGTTAIAQGGTTDETSVRITATVSDPDLNNVQIEVEIIDNAGAFTDTPNCMSAFEVSGESATASCTGLSVGTAYKWQIRTNDGTAVSAWQQYGGTDPDVTVSSDHLMHNSLTAGNATYGAWGVTGGKYGKFVCATCHTSSGGTTNIKMIKQTIDAPNATDTWPNGSTTTGSIVFTQADGTNSDMGDTSATGGWTGVCNVCHDNANHTHYSYNSSDGTHNAGMDCSECHRHSKAFSANCDNCHGNPPVDGTTLVEIPGTTGSTTAGAHNTHVNTKSYICRTCHGDNINLDLHNNGGSRDVTIGFDLWGTGVQVGDYDGQLAVTYDAIAPTTVTTPPTGAKACTVYCHSTGQSTTDPNDPTPTYASPVWDGTVTCGDCHTKAEVEGLTSGSHGAHLGTAGVSGCAACHTGAADDASSYNNANHVNELIDVANTYSAGGAPGNGYGTCTTALCHDNGTGAAPTPITTPVWGTTVTDCSECHATQPATGSHSAHLAETANGSSIVCANCHNDAVQGTTAPTGDHLDNNIDVKDSVDGDLGYTANKTRGSAPESCSTASGCHVSAYSTTNVVTPVWGTPADCGACHAIDATGAPATGSHNKHLTTVAVCANCHTGAVKDTSGGTLHLDGDIDVTNGYPAHVPKHTAGSGYSTCSTASCHSTVQAPGGGLPPTYKTPTWGGSVDCSSCHTDMSITEDLTLGTHKRHTNTPGVAQYSCSMCHGAGYSSTTVTYPPHVNSNIDTSFTGKASGTTYSQAGSNPPGSGYGTCSTNACHGRATKNWGVYTTLNVCEKCHGSKDSIAVDNGFRDTAGSTGSAYAGTHKSHLVAVHDYTDPIHCENCHVEPTEFGDPVTGVGHTGTLPATITWGDLPSGNILNPGSPSHVPNYSGAPTRTCSNTYCHSQGGTKPSPTWGDLGYGLSCGNCHQNPPVYPHPTSTNCKGCHYHVAASNTSFEASYRLIEGICSIRTYTDEINCTTNGGTWTPEGVTVPGKTLHIDGRMQVTQDNCLGCHTTYGQFALIGQHSLHTDNDYFLSRSFSTGTATGGSTTTVVDTSQSWTPTNLPDEPGLAGKYVRITSGLNNNQQIKILSNTANTITLTSAFADPVTNGTAYNIRSPKQLSNDDYDDPAWIYTIFYKDGFPRYACGFCHPSNSSTHRNGIANLDMDPTHSLPGTVKTKNDPIGPWFAQTQTGVNVTCLAVYCHSNGYVSPTDDKYAYKVTPNWYATTPWAALDRCSQCHGNSPTTGGSIGSPAHAKHVVGIHYNDTFSGTSGKMATSHGDGNSTTINCNICHNGTVNVAYNDKNSVCSTCHSVSPQGTMTVDPVNTTHVNGTTDISFVTPLNLKTKAQLRDDITTVPSLNSSWTRSGGYKALSTSHDLTNTTPSYSAGTCSSTACHNGTPMQWGQAGPLQCVVCHLGVPR